MNAKRKQKLKQREEKQARAEARKRECFQRVITTMGLAELFRTLPRAIEDCFLDRFLPGLEIVATNDSRDVPEVQRVVEEMKILAKFPRKIQLRDRVVKLSLDDYLRCWLTVETGIDFFRKKFSGRLGSEPGPIRRMMERAYEILQGHRGELKGLYWVLFRDLYYLTWPYLRMDGRIMEVRLTSACKPMGAPYDRLIVRMNQPRPHVLAIDGARWTAFPCVLPCGLRGLKPVRWTCRPLGIPSSKDELPVFIEKHAIARLNERLDVQPNMEPVIHRLMMNCLLEPVLVPREPGKYLVEARLGPAEGSSPRVGYFVAQVFPELVLIKTFLFLTMQGTPEAELLREKLGFFRADVEHYQLDNFMTLVGSDIVHDPLLARVLTECGCGHLLTMVSAENRTEWLKHHAQRLKDSFDLREARGGFMVGQKWIRWSEPAPTTP
jgi:hypothetical protein